MTKWLPLLLTMMMFHSISQAGGWITSGVRAASPVPTIPPGPLHFQCEMYAQASDGRETYYLSEEFTSERFDHGSVTYRAPMGPEAFLAGQALTLRVTRNSVTNQDTVWLSIEAVRDDRSATQSSVTTTNARRDLGFISANVQVRLNKKKGTAASRRASINLNVTCRDLDVRKLN